MALNNKDCMSLKISETQKKDGTAMKKNAIIMIILIFSLALSASAAFTRIRTEKPITKWILRWIMPNLKKWRNSPMKRSFVVVSER